MAKFKYSKEDLINKLIDFYNMYGKVPTNRDLKHTPGYPTDGAYIRRFGSYKEALRVAGLLDKRDDPYMFDRHEYTKDEVINLLKDYIQENGISTAEQTCADPKMPCQPTFCRLFGSFNNAIRELGYEPLYNYHGNVSNDELIDLLQKIYKEQGNVTSRNMVLYGYSATIFQSHFGSLYNAYKIAGIPYKETLRTATKEEIIKYWRDLKDKLGHVPTREEIEDSGCDVTNAMNPKSRYWNSYTDFLHSIGEEANCNYYSCKPRLSKKGTKCFSVIELRVTDWLEDNDIQFKKEVLYSTVIPNDKSRRRFDWVITHNSITYYVELFGIKGRKFYEERKKEEN